MTGGMGLISVPSSCSILYLLKSRENRLVNTFPGVSASHSLPIQSSVCVCVLGGGGGGVGRVSGYSQVEPVIIGDQIDSEAEVAEAARAADLT